MINFGLMRDKNEDKKAQPKKVIGKTGMFQGAHILLKPEDLIDDGNCPDKYKPNTRMKPISKKELEKAAEERLKLELKEETDIKNCVKSIKKECKKLISIRLTLDRTKRCLNEKSIYGVMPEIISCWKLTNDYLAVDPKTFLLSIIAPLNDFNNYFINFVSNDCKYVNSDFSSLRNFIYYPDNVIDFTWNKWLKNNPKINLRPQMEHLVLNLYKRINGLIKHQRSKGTNLILIPTNKIVNFWLTQKEYDEIMHL